MHRSAILHDCLTDSKEFGWENVKATHNWETMRENVQNHIKSLNWGYRVQLREKKVNYLNKLGSFVDAKTIKCVDAEGKEENLTFDKCVIAVGGRPRNLNIPGAEHTISSDDIFSLEKSPGKTLCVGASYISLESAGFLAAFGCDTTVLVRSILLRGFDQQMAEKVGEGLTSHNVKFKHTCIPTKIEKLDDGKLKVFYKNTTSGETFDDTFDTVLVAVGRNADTEKLCCDKAGVKLHEKNGKVIGGNGGDTERSSNDNVYAIGDVLEGSHELTPVAIQAGKLLADRLFGGLKTEMDYVNVPTAVFTPVEYGACGYSEEDAEAKYGKENLTIYHTEFVPLEWTVPHRDQMGTQCYLKIICNKKEQERVVGFHYYGPNAGEITQGYGLAIKLGATKADFDNVVGIHPTTAEVFTTLEVTKESGESAEAAGC